VGLRATSTARHWSARRRGRPRHTWPTGF
jgi:hypothetical protein